MKIFRSRKRRQRQYQQHVNNHNGLNAQADAGADSNPIFTGRNQQTDWDDFGSLQASSNGSSSCNSDCGSGDGENRHGNGNHLPAHVGAFPSLDDCGSGDGGHGNGNHLPVHVGAFPSLGFVWNDETQEVHDDFHPQHATGSATSANAPSVSYAQMNVRDDAVNATNMSSQVQLDPPPDWLEIEAASPDQNGSLEQQNAARQQGQQLAPEHRRLMGAWLSKRRLMFGLHSNGESNSGPVDVDALWDDIAVQTPSASVLDDSDTVCCHHQYDEEDEETHMTVPTRHDDKSAASVATSDQTPVMHNHDVMSMYDHVERSRRSNSTTGRSSDEEFIVMHPNHHTTGYCNLRSRMGKAVCILFIFLFVAVATMIGSAVRVHRQRQVKDLSSSNDSGDAHGATTGDTAAPSDNNPLDDTKMTVTSQPTLSPTQIPTLLTFSEDVTAVAASTPSPISQAPTVLPTPSMTRQPTSMPTPAPTTDSVISLTAAPSTQVLEPSYSPTTTAPMTLHPSTSSPTTSPSLQPSTLTPTLTPTTQVPSSHPTTLPTEPMPTASPTLPLASVEFALSGVWNGHSLRDGFGSAVKLSANGRVLVVGAPNAAVRQADGSMRQLGSVTILEKSLVESQATWIQRAVLTGEKELDTFGSAVAVNHDGSVVAVSEPTHGGEGDKAGRVLVYKYDMSLQTYEQTGSPLPGPARSAYFGVDIALDGSGARLAVGAPYHSSSGRQYRMHGAMYVYGQSSESDQWNLIGEPLYGDGTLDWFGTAVDLSDDGYTVVASAPRSPLVRGFVRVFRWNDVTRSWVRLGQDIINDQGISLATDRFGHSLSISSQGNKDALLLAIGIPFKDHMDGTAHAGMTAVYGLDADSKEWTLLGSPITIDDHGSGDNLGYSVQFGDGGLLAIGAPGANAQKSGSVHLYRYLESSSQWEKHPVDIDGASYADQFGFAVALSKENVPSLAVGARQPAEGAGYVTAFVSYMA